MAVAPRDIRGKYQDQQGLQRPEHADYSDHDHGRGRAGRRVLDRPHPSAGGGQHNVPELGRRKQPLLGPPGLVQILIGPRRPFHVQPGHSDHGPQNQRRKRAPNFAGVIPHNGRDPHHKSEHHRQKRVDRLAGNGQSERSVNPPQKTRAQDPDQQHHQRTRKRHPARRPVIQRRGPRRLIIMRAALIATGRHHRFPATPFTQNNHNHRRAQGGG
jgi:hypothetical protein